MEETKDRILVPLDHFVRDIAREAAWLVINEHERRCTAMSLIPIITDKVHKLEISYAKLIGFMAGTGLIGGSLGAAIVKALKL